MWLFHIFNEAKFRCDNCGRCMDKTCPCENNQKHAESCRERKGD